MVDAAHEGALVRRVDGSAHAGALTERDSAANRKRRAEPILRSLRGLKPCNSWVTHIT